MLDEQIGKLDRAVAQAALKITPDGPEAGMASRAFLRRGAVWLVEQGDDFELYSSGLRIETAWAVIRG